MGTPGWVAIGVAVLTLLGLVGAGVTWLYRRVLKPLILLITDWAGEEKRAGITPRPGVMERLMVIEERLSSVPALEARLTRVERRLAAIEAQGNRAQVEAGGGGFQAERADVVRSEDARFGFASAR